MGKRDARGVDRANPLGNLVTCYLPAPGPDWEEI